MKRAIVLSGTVLLSCCFLTTLANGRSFAKKKHLYAQIDVGMTSEDWQDFKKLPAQWGFSQAGHSGVSFGGLLGMQLYKHLSVEAGGDFLPKAEYSLDKKQYDIAQSLFYLAGRLTARFSNTMELYTRLGLAYRHLDNSQDAVGSGDVTGPFMGLGVDYRFSRVLLVGAAYSHEPGDFTSDKLSNLSPNLNIFALTATYQFAS